MASMLTVLVVEDEPLIRFDLTMALEDRGFSVRRACNVLQAVAILAKHQVDAVVTDIDMSGGLSGLDLVEMIARLPCPICLVVTSGGSGPERGRLQARAVFVPKPYSTEAVVKEIRGQLSAERANSTALIASVASMRGHGTSS